jgi:hypothetical protein
LASLAASIFSLSATVAVLDVEVCRVVVVVVRVVLLWVGALPALVSIWVFDLPLLSCWVLEAVFCVPPQAVSTAIMAIPITVFRFFIVYVRFIVSTNLQRLTLLDRGFKKILLFFYRNERCGMWDVYILF